MSSVRLAIAILIAIGVPSAYADPIPTFHVTEATMHMGPNTVGDNILFAFTGPGVDITGIAGMGCFDWCSGQPIPPDTVTATSQIFLSNLTTLTVGGVSYPPFATFVGPGFFDSSGGLNPSTTFFPGDAITPVKLTLPSSGWSLNFAPTTDQEGNSAVFFVEGTFLAREPAPATPEPATLGLMLAGSAGIGWITRKKKRH
jgi:hypothetical protein